MAFYFRKVRHVIVNLLLCHLRRYMYVVQWLRLMDCVSSAEMLMDNKYCSQMRIVLSFISMFMPCRVTKAVATNEISNCSKLSGVINITNHKLNMIQLVLGVLQTNYRYSSIKSVDIQENIFPGNTNCCLKRRINKTATIKEQITEFAA